MAFVPTASKPTKAWFDLNPHYLQSKLWRTDARFTVVVAGRGSGKTELNRRKIVRWLQVDKPWMDPIYFYGLPTYNQAKRVAWEPINALIPDSWVVKNGRNKSDLCITTIYGSKLYIVGMDKPQRIEGIQVDGGVLDECSDQRPGTYEKTILPMLTHRNGWCARIGVPKRNGIGSTDFKNAFEAGLKPNSLGLESYTWASNTVLTPDQLATIAGQLAPKDFEEQMGGVWVDADGQIFYAYSDDMVGGNVSSAAQYDPNDVIGVGSDFNVDPMAWVLFHVKNGVVHVFDELWIRNTNTEQTLNTLFSRYANHRAGWYFFGDASSKARRTSASITDYVQIANDPRFEPKNINYPEANPALVDRFAITNAMLCNSLNVRRILINPTCVHLRADLQVRSYKEGTREPDDQGDIGHITDALGYPLCQLFPLSAVFGHHTIGFTGGADNSAFNYSQVGKNVF